MRVIHVTPSYKPAYIYGGTTISVGLLCEGLRELQIDVLVYTTTANGSKELWSNETETKVNEVKVIYFRRWLKGQIHLSYSLLKNLYSVTSKKDIYHIHSWWNATAIISAVIGIILGNKVILSPRGMLTSYSLNNKHSQLKKIFQKFIGQWILSRCLIHVTSEMEKQDVLQIMKHKRIIVIPNLAGKAMGRVENNCNKNNLSTGFKLLFFSRIDKKKGIERLFIGLSKLNISWHLSIAGSGSDTYIQFLKFEIERLQIKQNISWLGFIPHQMRMEVFNRNDLLVLFSQNENFANVILESLAVGLPVAISENVGLAEFVIENNLGWVTTNEPEDITLIIAKAFKEVDKRASIRKKAPSLIESNFDNHAICSQYLALYKNDEC
jgi:glycosyltransferase involved in cell wall biosynthesis